MSKTKFFNFKDLFNKGEESENSSDVNPTISILPETYKSYLDTDEGIAKNSALSTAIKDFNSYSKPNWANEETYQNWLNKKLTRDKFSYDVNADALYQQLKDNYIQQGKMAMEDAMGQASAMTGGYGNSYAATVGNQAYQAHLENLNDIIPELYQMALEKYDMEGREIAENLAYLESDYAKHLGEEERDYSRLLDSIDIASSDLYNSLSLYNSEQKNNNDTLYPSLDDGNTKEPVTGDGEEEEEGPEYKTFTRKADASLHFNPQTYLSNKKNNGGSYYDSIKEDIEQMKSAGKSIEDIESYLIDLYGNSFINPAEYRKLLNIAEIGEM